MTSSGSTADHGGRPSRRLQATIVVTVEWDAAPLDQENSPVAMADAYRRALQRSHLRGDPQVPWPGAPYWRRWTCPARPPLSGP
jgi:hypothetical protein